MEARDYKRFLNFLRKQRLPDSVQRVPISVGLRAPLNGFRAPAALGTIVRITRQPDINYGSVWGTVVATSAGRDME
jgi:hypothetical protein